MQLGELRIESRDGNKTKPEPNELNQNPHFKKTNRTNAEKAKRTRTKLNLGSHRSHTEPEDHLLEPEPRPRSQNVFLETNAKVDS